MDERAAATAKKRRICNTKTNMDLMKCRRERDGWWDDDRMQFHRQHVLVLAAYCWRRSSENNFRVLVASSLFPPHDVSTTIHLHCDCECLPSVNIEFKRPAFFSSRFRIPNAQDYCTHISHSSLLVRSFAMCVWKSQCQRLNANTSERETDEVCPSIVLTKEVKKISTVKMLNIYIYLLHTVYE